ncbi:hypothetical protein HRG_000397 [Hirsutella rhossiliensis]|uniref:Mitochondrial inner membrane protein 1 n=1 Tax=Hirsutella rhossiliensis TaxID=111463 RepID=A0A9P8N6B9_9HYPO|nr:uncharacterized protein HRG_00397 [Hirsutella rhossiliensis]KAH0967755.1 hypothetical protein HRG_00397 [Hirsutella rhossiliensis]
MFRASRSLLRLAPRASPLPSRSLPRPCPPAASSPLPWSVPVARFASSSDKSTPPPPKQPIDRDREKELGQRTLEARPAEVSGQSSVRHVMEGSQGRDDADLGQGLKHDIDIVHNTFRLSRVPRESHILGLAGSLPYLATSLSTVFLAWDLNKELPTGNAFYDAIFVNHETAQCLLNVIEPLQLGYGAVIISFLGAIHWGLEYAEKAPLLERTRFRYGIGVMASVVAWPTLLMPIEYALTTQFMAFVALYFVDSRAAVRGWAPPWYGIYRFLLTAMVGLAILVSLGLSSSMSAPGIADHDTDWTKLEAEEKERIRKEKEEAEKKAKKEAAARKKAEMKGDGKGAERKEGKNKEAKDNKNDAQNDDDKDGENEDKSGENEDKSDEKQGKKAGDKGNDEPKSQGSDKKEKDAKK